MARLAVPGGLWDGGYGLRQVKGKRRLLHARPTFNAYEMD
ncbi:hypothetical protein D3OALGB2SA_1085 [Olavius algarvensis associated proteobacterium Delta 3]|nr:hypothetical protein D3OALGB2SA_1085 [Olavius algarvensis associated proteobacterium Delta 3]